MVQYPNRTDPHPKAFKILEAHLKDFGSFKTVEKLSIRVERTGEIKWPTSYYFSNWEDQN